MKVELLIRFPDHFLALNGRKPSEPSRYIINDNEGYMDNKQTQDTILYAEVRFERTGFEDLIISLRVGYRNQLWDIHLTC